MAIAINPKPDSSPQIETPRRDWIIFNTLIFLFYFGFMVYMGMFQNFIKDILHATPLDLGKLESLRELPGLCSALMAGTLAALAEANIAGLGMLICGIGIGLSGWMGGLNSLIAMSVFWSVGFHLFTSVQSALVMALAKGKEAGFHLGQTRRVSSIASIVGLVSSFGASLLLPKNDYTPYFVVAGISIVISAVLCMRLSAHASGGQRSRIVFKKEYGLFYVLTFLDGCRRQIFSIFAFFALIFVFHQPVTVMLGLQVVNALVIMAVAPKIGRVIDKIGERTPLTWYAIGLIVVFLGYAVFGTVQAMFVLFLLDNLLFTLNVGFTTYLHRIALKEDFTPSLSMGVTMNHVAAVTVPFFGTLLWVKTQNYQYPFYVGVAVAAISLLFTRMLPKDAGLKTE